MNIVPTVAELIADFRKVNALPLEAIPPLRGKLAELDTLLVTRLLQSGDRQGQTASQGDGLLNAKEAAGRLRMSLDYVYKHASEFPFAVKEGRRRLFSARGIEEYLVAKIKKKGLDL